VCVFVCSALLQVCICMCKGIFIYVEAFICTYTYKWGWGQNEYQWSLCFASIFTVLKYMAGMGKYLTSRLMIHRWQGHFFSLSPENLDYICTLWICMQLNIGCQVGYWSQGNLCSVWWCSCFQSAILPTTSR